MKKLIIANWKMNPQTGAQALKLARVVASGIKNIKNVEVILAPPFVFLPVVSSSKFHVSGFGLGAQNVFYENPHGWELTPARFLYHSLSLTAYGWLLWGIPKGARLARPTKLFIKN